MVKALRFMGNKEPSEKIKVKSVTLSVVEVSLIILNQ